MEDEITKDRRRPIENGRPGSSVVRIGWPQTRSGFGAQKQKPPACADGLFWEL